MFNESEIYESRKNKSKDGACKVGVVINIICTLSAHITAIDQVYHSKYNSRYGQYAEEIYTVDRRKKDAGKNHRRDGTRCTNRIVVNIIPVPEKGNEC